MRILLIDPPTNCFTGLLKRGFPIGLCTLAAVAKEEGVEKVAVYEVDRCHPTTYGLDFTDQRANMAKFLRAVNDPGHVIWHEIDRTLRSFEPDLVGITSMTIQYASALRVAEIVKKWNQNCLVIMGGAHASVMASSMVEWPFTDAVVKGDGEDAFRSIIRKFGSGSTSFADIPGVVTKDSMEKADHPPLVAKNLEEIPFPDRSTLMNLEAYSPEDMGLILTSRGCPFKCTYCSNFTRRSRFRSVENVFEEIRLVKEQFGTIQFMFKDDSFTLNRKRVEALCKRILDERLNVVWECTTRLDLLDASLVSLLRSAGCNRVGVGVESGDDEILKLLDKGLTTDKIRRGTAILDDKGMFWTGYFMMGLPIEREDQILRTLNFMHELKPPYAAVGIYKPYPGTKLFDLAADLDLVHSRVSNEHFFRTNPVDYFIKDPSKRSANISESRLNTLLSMMEEQFDHNNKRITNIWKRAWARRRIYSEDYRSFATDVVRAARWFVPSVWPVTTRHTPKAP